MARGRSKEFLLSLRRKYRLGEFRCGPSTPRTTSKAKPRRVSKPTARTEVSLWGQ